MTLRSSAIGAAEMIILPPVRDLGDGFTVRRALPSAHRRMVGPFIFFDQMGPVTMSAGHGLDVRPHPHIGLATVTYLLEGEILHRDSLGIVQPIRPGAVNWMTAGRGIVHSERSADDVRATGGPLYGLQTWVALPADKEEIESGFVHYPAEAIPQGEADGARLRVIAGSHEGLISPVAAASPTLYVDIALEDGAAARIPADYTDRALYIVSGAVAVDGQYGGFQAGELVVLKPSAEIVLRGIGPTRLMLAGGEPLDEPRHIFWNFVSSRPERIEQAKQDWRERRFPGVPGEHEFIPLPE
jgi:redox-sensitive bicupin YhaK (pirin superfamily)